MKHSFFYLAVYFSVGRMQVGHIFLKHMKSSLLCPTAAFDLSALNIFRAIKSQLLTHFQMEGNGGFPEYFKVNTEKCSFSTFSDNNNNFVVLTSQKQSLKLRLFLRNISK